MKRHIPKNFLPIEVVAYENNIDVYVLRSYFTRKTQKAYGNEERFLKIDGKYYVHQNYKYPFANDLEILRQKALIIAHTENNLCEELAKISGKNKTTLAKYFYRFTFKQIKQAKETITLLEQYIKQNSIFPSEELTYDY